MKRFLYITFIIFLFSPTSKAQLSKGLYSHKSTNNFANNTNPFLKKRSNGLYGHPLPGVFSIMLSAFGPAYLFGDVGGSIKNQALFGGNDWDLKNTRYLYSFGLRQIFPNNVAVKATAYYGKFAGSDIGSRNASRGYSFSSNVLEITLQGEYIFYGGPYSKPVIPHTLYAFGGAGVLNSNASFHGTLMPGATSIANVTAPVIPIGLGYQYKVNNKLTVGTELGWHYIMSDYIDGVHPQVSKSNDVLAILTFTFTYKIYGGVPNEDRCNCNK